MLSRFTNPEDIASETLEEELIREEENEVFWDEVFSFTREKCEDTVESAFASLAQQLNSKGQ